MRGSPAIVVAMVAASATPLAGSARAQALERNDFVIDLFQGPVLGSSRIVGMGGAHAGIAEGIDGVPWNPAANASRAPWELSWFEWEVSFSALFPGAFVGDDFFNVGPGEAERVAQFVFVSAGLRLQMDHVGIGALLHDQLFVVGRETPAPLEALLVRAHVGLAHQLLDGQLVAGLGVRQAALYLSSRGLGLVDFDGTAVETGLLVRLEGSPWRLGVAARSPVLSRAVRTDGVERGPDGVLRAAGFVLPRAVRMPWELQLGGAWQLGRPLNLRYDDPDERERRIRLEAARARWERERLQVDAERGEGAGGAVARDPYRWLPRRARDEAWWAAERARRRDEEALVERRIELDRWVAEQRVRRLARRYLLVTADVLLVGPTPDGVGIASFLAQRREPSGAAPSIGIRFGFETEPVAQRLKVRAGGYLEPGRSARSAARLHATVGCDVRLFSWDLFGLLEPFELRASVTGDVAHRYTDWGVGLGTWH
ncbi:MAG: hypothetical protein NZ898_09390 [Myxococcota bacterium]|nr:hypothetical protein [Myxococcota bacterium]MDW8362800.1 hypothetical protein [Myxococcales bacterium]